MKNTGALKFIYSEKVTRFCEVFPLLLTVCTVVKSKVKISQNFVAFSECMNFNLEFQEEWEGRGTLQKTKAFETLLFAWILVTLDETRGAFEFRVFFLIFHNM